MIIVLCGIPGSGKSTIGEMLATKLAALGSVQLVSSDRLKAPVYAKMFRMLSAAAFRADFLILDATFYKKEWRRQVSAHARGEKVITVYLHCPLSVALTRNQKRTPNISARALHVINRKMEPPESPEIKLDTASLCPDDAVRKILTYLRSEGMIR